MLTNDLQVCPSNWAALSLCQESTMLFCKNWPTLPCCHRVAFKSWGCFIKQKWFFGPTDVMCHYRDGGLSLPEVASINITPSIFSGILWVRGGKLSKALLIQACYRLSMIVSTLRLIVNESFQICFKAIFSPYGLCSKLLNLLVVTPISTQSSLCLCQQVNVWSKSKTIVKTKTAKQLWWG